MLTRKYSKKMIQRFNKLLFVLYFVMFLSIYSCKNMGEGLSVIENKFQLPHLNKTLVFNSLMKFDSASYPLQYPKDAIQLFCNVDSVVLYISIRQNMYLDNVSEKNNVNHKWVIQNLFQQDMKEDYGNRDTIFHNNNIGILSVKCEDIVYLERTIKNNILQTDINQYKLIPNRKVYYTSFVLDSFRMDLEIEFKGANKAINKIKALSDIVETFKLL